MPIRCQCKGLKRSRERKHRFSGEMSQRDLQVARKSLENGEIDPRSFIAICATAKGNAEIPKRVTRSYIGKNLFGRRRPSNLRASITIAQVALHREPQCVFSVYKIYSLPRPPQKVHIARVARSNSLISYLSDVNPRAGCEARTQRRSRFQSSPPLVDAAGIPRLKDLFAL